MRKDECVRLQIPIIPLDHTDTNVPTQADGQSSLEIVGKAKFIAERGKLKLPWEGYVCKNLHSAILCGGSFMEKNKVVQELGNKRIVVENKYYILETSPLCPDPFPEPSISTASEDNDQNNIVSDITPATDPIFKIDIGSGVPKKLKEKLISIHKSHSSIFYSDISKGYNGVSGDHDVDFHFVGDIPPPVHHGCVPSYTSRQDKVLMQAKIDQLEDQGVVAKAHEIGIIPKFASPTLLVQKNSVRELGKENYNSLPIAEKLKYNRLVLCQNKLNDFVQKIPHMYTTVEDTIKAVGEHEFVITTDLTDSFWQRHIKEDKKPYFAFHSPFRGEYIFLRSSQGFLNQSEGLENLIRCVLQDGVAGGWVVIHADNIYVVGNSMEETIDRWKVVLDKLMENNLKLSSKKTACFPTSLDLLGWSKQGKFLVPDEHRQNCLAKAHLPETTHDLRSYIGGYRRFFKAQQGMSQNLQELEELVAKSETKFQKLQWTEDLKSKFEQSKIKIKTLDKLYIPQTQDQLVLTSDWSKKGISATLWAAVDGKFLVVARTSCKLVKSQENMLPCEGECSAHYVAAKCSNFRGYIKASKLKTISLTDSKPVYQAANLLKKGKFSTSKLINELLTSIADLGLEYQHLSGKMGQNFVDDFGSRNPTECSDKANCKLCSFLKDCEEMTVGPVLSFTVSSLSVIANVDIREPRETNKLIHDIIRGATHVPFNNRQAMKFLQDQDPDLVTLRSYLLSGKRPQEKNTKLNSVKRYLQNNSNISIAKDGCIVVIKKSRKFIKSELVVIPENIAMGLLYGMHHNLNHPSRFQLSRVVDTKFFILGKEQKIRKLTEDCTLCQSVAKIPKEIHDFQPNQVPDHPGKSFTIDILRYAKKIIVVSAENFSGWISTVFIRSETHDQLLEGIIQTVLPFKASSLSKIRVDQAPGFRKLFKQKTNLSDLGIDLELGEAKNKNSLALVDRKMKELEEEIKKAAPSNNVIGVRILAIATNMVNEKDVNKGRKCLSAKEILFSRDQFTGENLPINDEEIAEETMENRKINNEYSSKSKATVKTKAQPAAARKGHIVFLKEDGSKLERRDMYLVTEVNDENQSLKICKLLNSLSNQPGTLQPQQFSYLVKQTDVFKAANQPVEVEYAMNEETDDQHWTTATKVPATELKGQRMNKYQELENDDDLEYEMEDDDNVSEYGDEEEQVGSYDEYDSEYDDEDEGEEDNDADVDNTSGAEDHETELENSNNSEESEDANGDNDTGEEDGEIELGGEDEYDQVEIDDNDQQGAGEVVEIQPIIDQYRKPKKGDILLAFIDGSWTNIYITTNEHKKWRSYYNFKFENGTENGIYLNPETDYWTFNINQVEEIGVERLDDETTDGEKIATPDISNDDRELTVNEAAVQEDSNFLDDDYSDQDSIFGNSNIEYLTNSCNSTLNEARHEAFTQGVERTIENDVGRAFKLAQRLNLELPRSGIMEANRVYTIPMDWRSSETVHRSRIRSASWSVLHEVPAEATQRSAWQRGIHRLRKFVTRFLRK